jgi:dinuclear metal center YbgI/SA1388 family protein
MNIADLVQAMERVAPRRYAQSWDNVGLLLGDARAPLAGPVLLAIDMTEAVVDEAGAGSVIVAYHPPVWAPLKRITAEDPKQRVLLTAARQGIAVYSPHTSLDAVPGGITDWLCEGLSGGEEGKVAGDLRALEPHHCLDEHQEVKLVTFVPEGEADRLRNALASAGAGIIGAYTVCSFGVRGTGTFFGEEGTNPAVGRSGRLERAEELRLEMVCSRAALPLAMETLAEFHPYEEPAVDVYELLPRPVRRAGAGRRVVLDRPATITELADRLKGHLGVPVVKIAPSRAEGEPLTHVGVCPGAGSSLAGPAMRAGCEVFVTGEMKHHEVLEAVQHGMGIILAGHTNTERGYLPRLARSLGEHLPGVEVRVSKTDRTPIRTY